MDARRSCLGGTIEGWSQQVREPVKLREVPFPGVPLILNLGPPWDIDGERHDSFVAGLHTAPAFVEGGSGFACIEVRLTPLTARRLLALPMHELMNRTVAADDVVPAARELTSRLRDARDWDARFDLVESFLLSRLADAPRPHTGVAWAWRRLMASGGRTRIGELADELGGSRRRLIGRFREAIGLAPKAAARVIRFDRAASALREGSAPPLAELALACGYFDQAHLNRDFRELAGTTPTAFAAGRLDSGGIAA